MASAWTSEARLRSQAPPDPRAFHSTVLFSLVLHVHHGGWGPGFVSLFFSF